MEKYRVGDLVWAKVLELLPNGALLQLDEETSGFLHLSEIGEGVSGAEEKLAEGMEVLVKVIGTDHFGRPLLSLRRVTEADREAAEFHREASGIPLPSFPPAFERGGRGQTRGPPGMAACPVAGGGRGFPHHPAAPPERTPFPRPWRLKGSLCPKGS
jgi:predicted RNA-binding protein with RPS1 domain